MKVKLLTRFPVGSRNIGIPNYATNLSEALEDQGIELENVSHGKGWKGMLNKMKAFESEVVHAASPSAALSFGFRNVQNTVATFHDPFIPLEYTEERDFLRRQLLKTYLWSASNADQIIAVSEDTKNAVKDRFGVPDEKITVVHNGVDHERFSPGDTGFHGKIRIGYLGGISQHKNVSTLIEAYLSMDSDRDTELVIGGFGPRQEQLQREYIGKEDVVLKGGIPEEEKVGFYRSMDIFVFPSLAEGFGLPLLEAMACGIPAISSNSTSLPEVGGDAALYFDPRDEKELAEKLEMLVDDPGLRDEVAEKCLERSREFSWEKTAKKTSEVYEKL